MCNALSFRVLLVFSLMAGWPATTASAQGRPSPNAEAPEIPIPEPPNAPYPSTFRPSFQWDYVCQGQEVAPRQTAAGCSIRCSPNSVISSVAAARVWLGTSDLGNVPVQAIYYYVIYYNGAQKVAGSGHVQSTRTLSCQALAMKITYSGPPK